MNQDLETRPVEVKKLTPMSINGYLVDPLITFILWDVWEAGYGNRILWVKDPSPAMLQILNLFSMWGGPTRHTIDTETNDMVYAWEIHSDRVEWFQELILITSRHRYSDKASL